MATEGRDRRFHLLDFLKEVAIVVLGVVLALTGGQYIDQLNWRQKTRELEFDMRTELLNDDMPKAVERIAAGACLFSVLDRISDAAESGANRTDLIALMREYRIGLTTWDMEAWRTLLTADSAGHISVQGLHNWYAPYGVIPELQRLSQNERDDLADLRGLRDAPGPLSEAEKVTLAHQLERLRTSNRHILAYSRIFMGALKRPGLATTQSMLDHAYAGIDADELGACATKPTLGELYGNTTAAIGQPHRRTPPSRGMAPP